VQPTLTYFSESKSIDGSFQRLVNYLNVKSLNIACGVVCIALACACEAQTYQVGPDNSTQSKDQKQDKKKQPQSQELGWGSNIQNARLARAAEQALQRGDHALALQYAQRASEAAPNDPQLWFLLGYAARLNGKTQESIDAYSHGLRLNPNALEGLSGLAQTYSTTGKNDEAKRLLKQVLAADPRRSNDALVLGDILMREQDYESALDALNRAERAHPDARPELLIGICYERLKRMDMATRYFDQARRHAPDNPEVQRSMAGYYREMGKYGEAINALKSIRNPKPDVLAELAYIYQLDGRPSDSARLYEQAANAEPKNIVLQLSAAQAEVAAGSADQAGHFLERASAIDAGNYRLHAIRGEIARMREQVADAIREYETALAGVPAEPAEGPLYSIQLRMDLMDLYKSVHNQSSADQQLKAAQSAINQLNEQGPDRAPFLRLRALIKMHGGNLDGALQDIRDALAMNAHDPNGLQLNGDILMKMGRAEDAIDVYKKILAIDANNRFALVSLGYASRAARRDQTAEKYFLQLAHADPTLYVPYLALGDLYTSKREFNKAQVSYEKGYALAPKNALMVAGGMNAAIEAHDLKTASTWSSRTTNDMLDEPQVLREKERYLSFKGDYAQSADVARQAIKALPSDRDVIVYLGYDLLHMEKWEDLLALTQQYDQVLPKEPDIPLLAGYVHKHQGQAEFATKDFTETLKRDPEVVTAYVNRGYMLNDLRRSQEAANDFEAALKREPNDGEAHLGLAYADLELHKYEGSLKHADLAQRAMGDSKNVHVIRATAYGRQDMLAKASAEYRSALKFDPNDPSLHLGLANALFGARQYREAIGELETSERLSPGNPEIYALLARSYANLDDRESTMHYVELAEQHARGVPGKSAPSQESDILVSTGQALSTLGDQDAAMERFRRALGVPGSNRMDVRLAIAQVMAQQDQTEEAEREIALALMEAAGGDTAPPSGPQFVLAADVFRSVHDYQLSQNYLQRAKTAGAPDTQVRIGLANNYLAMGDTTKAHAELEAVRTEANSAPDYQYLLAQANVFRQEHQNTQALTSFAQASNASGDDPAAQEGLLQAGADEGLRITPSVSTLSDFSMRPVFEDTTVYALDAKLDAPPLAPGGGPSPLPPPRSSLETQWTGAYHLHLNHLPTPSGFFQLRNQRGAISVPAINSIVNRNTTDYTINFGLNPSVRLRNNVFTFNGGFQTTLRRDSESPVQMNQNLYRWFVYMNTSSFFNAVTATGYIIRESGPFTEANLHSRTWTAALDFRVGAPWGKTALVTGWGATDQFYTPVSFENYYTSAYIGLEHRFSQRFNARAILEDLRSWRVVTANEGIAQDLRPAAQFEYRPNKNWNFQANTSYSSTRSFHVYDAIQGGFSVTYARPVRRKFHDDSGAVVLEYPIRFSGGLQEETFFNFTGAHKQQFRPYVQISLF
jgi:tetratricopeptide (TPR) repeat protein